MFSHNGLMSAKGRWQTDRFRPVALMPQRDRLNRCEQNSLKSSLTQRMLPSCAILEGASPACWFREILSIQCVAEQTKRVAESSTALERMKSSTTCGIISGRCSSTTRWCLPNMMCRCHSPRLSGTPPSTPFGHLSPKLGRHKADRRLSVPQAPERTGPLRPESDIRSRRNRGRHVLVSAWRRRSRHASESREARPRLAGLDGALRSP